MKLYRIAMANMKKKKSMVISLFFLITLAGLFLNIGIKIIWNVGDLYDIKSKELNSAQTIIHMNNAAYKPEFLTFFEEDSRVKDVELEDIAFMSQAKLHYKGGSLDVGTMISNIEDNRLIGTIQILEKTAVPDGKAIYLPVSMKSYGFKTNGTFELSYQGITYSFLVAGFYESPYFGVSNYGCFRYFVNAETFQDMREKVGSGKLISVRLYHANDSNAVIDDLYHQTDFRKVKSDAANFIQISPNNVIEICCMMGANMFGGFAIAFAIIMLIILLIVIRFRILDTIQDNMTNNGALQAMGYTSQNVRTTMIIEFMGIALFAAVFSTFLSYLIMPAVCNMVSSSNNLVWNMTFVPLTDMLEIVVIVGTVYLITTAASRKIKKYPPVAALRKGGTTHSFKKNYFPLNKYFANVNTVLALKFFMGNLKSNGMIAIIISFLTFVCCFVTVLYINFGLDSSFLYQMMGREISDVQISITSQTDPLDGLGRIQEMPQVRKAYYSDQTNIIIDGIDTLVTVAEDCSQFELLSAYKGKLPEYQNEVVIFGTLAKQLNKEIGDTIIAEFDGIEREYYICGLAQSMSGLGQEAIMTLAGVHRVNPAYLMRTAYVYVDGSMTGEEFEKWIYANYRVADRGISQSLSGEEAENDKYARVKAKADAKIAKLLADYGVDTIEYSLMVDGETVLSGGSSSLFIKKVTNLKSWGDGQLKSYASMMTAMCAVFIFVTLGIIILILSLVIKSMIRNRRQEFGTYKALGFTTDLLVRQVGLNFLTVSIIGTIGGGILSFSFSNKILGAIFEQAGITNPLFGDFPGVIILIAIGMSTFTYVTSLIIARRIREISVYQLLTE